MRPNYSPQEAVSIALRYYDELRVRGVSRDEALEQTVRAFRLKITPSEFDVLVMARDNDYEERAGNWHPGDADIQCWLDQPRSKGR